MTRPLENREPEEPTREPNKDAWSHIEITELLQEAKRDSPKHEAAIVLGGLLTERNVDRSSDQQI